MLVLQDYKLEDEQNNFTFQSFKLMNLRVYLLKLTITQLPHFVMALNNLAHIPHIIRASPYC